MDAGSQPDTAKVSLATWFAGLESGLVGVLWMLAWLGMSSLWQQRSFWTTENLMSTAFDRNAALNGLRWGTISGLAVYLLVYSLLGAVFAMLARERVPRHRLTLAGIIFAMAWYYLTFRFAFQYALPLVALLHVEATMIVGHVLYGAILGRFPIYAYRLMNTEPPAPEAERTAAIVEIPVVIQAPADAEPDPLPTAEPSAAALGATEGPDSVVR